MIDPMVGVRIERGRVQYTESTLFRILPDLIPLVENENKLHANRLRKLAETYDRRLHLSRTDFRAVRSICNRYIKILRTLTDIKELKKELVGFDQRVKRAAELIDSKGSTEYVVVKREEQND